MLGPTNILFQKYKQPVHKCPKALSISFSWLFSKRVIPTAHGFTTPVYADAQLLENDIYMS